MFKRRTASTVLDSVDVEAAVVATIAALDAINVTYDRPLRSERNAIRHELHDARRALTHGKDPDTAIRRAIIAVRAGDAFVDAQPHT